MKISCLQRTFKDFLEVWETQQQLPDPTGDAKTAFKLCAAILKGHILMIKALCATNIRRRPAWRLVSDVLTSARGAERDTQIG
jgi:hypothetical protein